MRTRLLALVVSSLAAAACGGPAPTTEDASTPPSDGGPSDRIAPTVRSTTPASGESDVPRESELVVRFSEPMDVEAGSVRVAPGDATIRVSTGEWDAAGSVLTIVPTTPWPVGEVTLTLEGMIDLAGNALDAEPIVFTTADDVRPEVALSTPAENATGVSARLDAIVIRFDEPMRAVGTLDVLGGAATIGAPTWSADAATVTFPVADLEYERDYDVTLRGFTDANGNRLDTLPYLEDGVLDFSTGADADGPRALRSEPGEGQLDVNPALYDAILVTFDEVMDTSITSATLVGGTTTVPVTGTWSGSGRIFRVETAGMLEFGVSYALDLGDLQDRAGNPIDGTAYLGDGRVDFTVGLDAFLPFATASAPAEGEVDVSYTETTEITVAFSEAMDTSITTAELGTGGTPVTVTGTWRSDTEISFDVAGRVPASATVSLDLRGMRDARGNALDAAQRYLGDGRLDFQTSAAIGDGCLDPLTTASATVDGPSFSWTITSLQGAVRDGGTSYCDSNGTTANGTDVVVRFDKTSGRVGTSGGRYLRVVLDGASSASGSNSFDIAVATGAACDPSAIPVRCHSNAGLHQVDLDLDAGPVWIWVSRTTSSTTSVAATLTVSEIDPPTIEGESCERPFTTASAIYMPPATGERLHRFSVAANTVTGTDITPNSYHDGNAFSCDTAAGHGIDSVIAFDKPDDASVLRITARRTSGLDSLNLEVFDACDATAAGTRRLGCRTGVSTTAPEPIYVDGPAGPLHVWVGDTTTTVSRTSSVWQTNPAFDVDIEVIPDVQTGEICSRAFAAAAGVNAVAGTSGERIQPPGCFDPVSNVEWYRLTTTQDVTFVSANAAGGLAMLSPTTGAQLACVADGMARPLTRVLPVGTTVCIGVEMGRSITSIDVTGQPYGGLGSTPPVELGILRPYGTTGTEETVTSEYWMALSGSTLLMRHSSSAIMDVSHSGGERAVRRGTADGVTSTNTGRFGVVVDRSLFSFSTSTTATATRVTRLWDGRSVTWRATPWDTTAPYTGVGVWGAARDGTSNGLLYLTSSSTSTTTPTIFYRVSTVAPSPPAMVASTQLLDGVRSMVADDQFVYVVASVSAVRGIYRLPRADLTATPTLIASGTRFAGSSTYATAMVLDSLTAPQHLYVRNDDGDVEAIIDPAGASPFYLGPVIDLGTANDFAMTLDHATGQLYLFETETVSTGNWIRFDP